ncbi:MAG: cytochrome-c peroxidase, partial [Bacteroidota bacterium]
MKSDSILLFGSLFISILLISISKPRKTSKSSYVDKAIGNINAKFQRDLSSFQESTIQFYRATKSLQENKTSIVAIQKHYQSLRTSFKRVEFFLEYLDKEAYDKVLNGAPLPKLEKKVADLTILDPKGIQVIDELIGGEDLTQAKIQQQLLDQALKLKNDTKKIQMFLGVRSVTDRQFFEASRQAVIRLITLGITGFDTPGTLSGVTDAAVVLESQKEYLQYYESELEQVQAKKLWKQYRRLSNRGLSELRSANFERLNRMFLIKEVLNPIYKNIRDIHLALDYETIEEVSRYPLAVNYEADNIFDKEFLNKFYYVSMTRDSNYEKVAKLGKLLFYDPVLSNDNKMACASCHTPDKAFTDGLPTSTSNKGIPLERNAMTLNYSGYASGFFHDLRTKRLEDQFEHVVLSEDEFNSTYPDILEELKDSKTYTTLFSEAFPGEKEAIKSNNVDYALAAYIMKLSSFDSAVDQYFQGAIDELPKEVEKGFNLFTGKANCATCHFLPLYSGLVPPLYKESEAEVLGVPDSEKKPWILDDDMGRLGN